MNCIEPLFERLRRPLSDFELNSVVERRAEPITLGAAAADKDAESFFAAASQIYLVGPQEREILCKLFDCCLAHAERHFVDTLTYTKQLYKDKPWGSFKFPPICLTGLGGVGKSEILVALARLLDDDIRIDVPGISNIRLQPLWSLSLGDGTALNAIFQPVLKATDDGEVKTLTQKIPSNSKVIAQARRKSWRSVACLMVIDEFQNITKVSASTLATDVLIKLLEIGPRLVYCANFSLIHKLAKRPQQDGHKLLVSPIVMLPDRQGSPSWMRYLTEIQKISPATFLFDCELTQKLIHDYTFGIRRHVVQLLKVAYTLARKKQKNCTIGRVEIERAFSSMDFTLQREEVKSLFEQAAKASQLREDLWCPFQAQPAEFWYLEEVLDGCDPSSVQDALDGSAKVFDAGRAKVDWNQRVLDAYTDRTMTRAQAVAMGVLAPEVRSHRPAKVVRIRQKPATDADLDAGAHLLDRLD